MRLFERATIRCDQPDCKEAGQVMVKVVDGIAWFPEHPGGWTLTDDGDYCPRHAPVAQSKTDSQK